jgi:thymidylate synthase
MDTSNVMIPTFHSLDDMQQWVFNHLLSDGVRTSPRGVPTLEVAPTQLVLLNPRQRILTSPARRWSLPLAVGEFCWHLSGSNELAFIQYYSDRWHEFADDERTIRGSCYGYRIFGRTERASQWEEAHNLLRYDPCTRRAVIMMSQPLTDNEITAKDIACASSLQFLLRDGRLDAVLHMRSNDAFWGLPYDVFLFTMLQELFAAQLNVGLGVYYHSVASLHLYEKHLRTAEKILADKTQCDLEMSTLSHPEELARFLGAEHALRLHGRSAKRSVPGLPRYWRELAEILEWYSLVKQGMDKKQALGAMSIDSPYQPMIARLAEGTRLVEK